MSREIDWFILYIFWNLMGWTDSADDLDTVEFISLFTVGLNVVFVTGSSTTLILLNGTGFVASRSVSLCTDLS